MKKLLLTLSRKTLLTIYKSFVRPNLDYAEIIYAKTFNESSKKKLETVEYGAVLVINGAFEGTICDSLYKELGMEFLAHRKWSQKLIFFHKILNSPVPSYVHSYSI